jgi:hypothetical protein
VPNPLIWSMLEPSLGLTLASVPIMRPVFTKIFPDSSLANNSGGSNIIISNPTGSGVASKNFQRIDEYPLDTLRPDLSGSHTYVTEGQSRIFDMESQKSSQSEAELVASHIRVKQEWNVRRT